MNTARERLKDTEGLVDKVKAGVSMPILLVFLHPEIDNDGVGYNVWGRYWR